MNKRILAILLMLVMSITMLGGCKSVDQEESAYNDVAMESPDEEKSEEPGEESETPSSDEKPKGEQSEKENPSKEETPDKDQEKEEKPQQQEQQETPSKQPDTQTPSTKPSPEEELANFYENGVSSTAIAYTGKNTRAENYSVSKPISVKGGDTITFGPASSAQVVQGYAYNDSGKPIELINASVLKEEATFLGGMKIYTYEVPAGATMVKMNVHNRIRGDFVVARNHPFDLKSYSNLSGTPADFVDDVLKEKVGLFVGDSICNGSKDTAGRGWATRIEAQTGLIAINNAKGGISVSNVRPQGTVLSRLMEKKDQDFEYVVLHGGVNDAWSLAEVGEMDEGFDPVAFDQTTFAGGLELLIYNAIKTYGDKAAIGYLVNFKAPACGKGTVSDMREYNKVAMEICKKWGITYFDMYNHEEITLKLKMDTTAHTPDYIHPSSSGYDVLTPYITDYMRQMTPCSAEMLKKILG